MINTLLYYHLRVGKMSRFFETTKQSGDFVVFHRAILQYFIGRFCNILSGDFGIDGMKELPNITIP